MDKKILMSVLAGGVAFALAARSYRTISAEARAEREDIRNNADLDVRAIREAADAVTARIDRGEIRSLTELAAALDTEIKFRKITIREES